MSVATTLMPATIAQVGHRRLLRAEAHTLGKLGEGIVEAYASVFDVEFMEGSSLFRRKVRIEKGAFAESLATRASFPVMWEHDWDAGPAGHTVEEEEDDHGLRARSQLYVDSERGRNLWRGMDAGALTEWSIAFFPTLERKEKRETDDGDEEEIVVYEKVDLAELSVVVRGANPDTETISVQSAIEGGLRLARGGVVEEVVINGTRYGAAVLGGGLAIEELTVEGTRYWAVPVCQTAIAPHSTDVIDEPWDGPAEEAKISNDAGASVLRRMYAWVEPERDADTKAAYGFPHHRVTNGEPGAANVRGVRNALTRLPQSNVPASEQEGVRRHLTRHLDDFREREAEASAIPGAERLLRRAAVRQMFGDGVGKL